MSTGLSIINRFFRTLRDMVGKNKPIDRELMNQLLYRYNKTIHSTTGMAPKDMTEEDEIRYMVNMQLEKRGFRKEDY